MERSVVFTSRSYLPSSLGLRRLLFPAERSFQTAGHIKQ